MNPFEKVTTSETQQNVKYTKGNKTLKELKNLLRFGFQFLQQCEVVCFQKKVTTIRGEPEYDFSRRRPNQQKIQAANQILERQQQQCDQLLKQSNQLIVSGQDVAITFRTARNNPTKSKCVKNEKTGFHVLISNIFFVLTQKKHFSFLRDTIISTNTFI